MLSGQYRDLRLHRTLNKPKKNIAGGVAKILPKNPRVWFYFVISVIILSMLGYKNIKVNAVNKAANEAAAKSNQEARDNLATYLAKQTDERKLVRLSKQLSASDETLTEMTLQKAYELNPNSRDIAVLLSTYKPELSDKIKQLDPLYGSPTPSL